MALEKTCRKLCKSAVLGVLNGEARNYVMNVMYDKIRVSVIYLLRPVPLFTTRQTSAPLSGFSSTIVANE